MHAHLDRDHKSIIGNAANTLFLPRIYVYGDLRLYYAHAERTNIREACHRSRPAVLYMAVSDEIMHRSTRKTRTMLMHGPTRPTAKVSSI